MGQADEKSQAPCYAPKTGCLDRSQLTLGSFRGRLHSHLLHEDGTSNVSDFRLGWHWSDKHEIRLVGSNFARGAIKPLTPNHQKPSSQVHVTGVKDFNGLKHGRIVSGS